MIVQLLAYASTLLSIWLAGKKSVWGPVVGAIGFIPWSLLAWSHGVWSMVAFNAVITGLHLRNLYLWSRPNGPHR